MWSLVWWARAGGFFEFSFGGKALLVRLLPVGLPSVELGRLHRVMAEEGCTQRLKCRPHIPAATEGSLGGLLAPVAQNLVKGVHGRRRGAYENRGWGLVLNLAAVGSGGGVAGTHRYWPLPWSLLEGDLHLNLLVN